MEENKSNQLEKQNNINRKKNYNKNAKKLSSSNSNNISKKLNKSFNFNHQDNNNIKLNDKYSKVEEDFNFDLTKKIYNNYTSSSDINNDNNNDDNLNNNNLTTEIDEIKDNSDMYANQLFSTINKKSEMFLNKFWKIYVKLLESLHLIWPHCVVTELFLEITLKNSNNQKKKQNVIENWYTTMKPYFIDCLDHNILKITNAKIYFIEKIDFIKKYDDVKNDEESCNNIWEFIINLNRYSLEYHNWSKDDFMNKMITTVTSQIGKTDINNLLNDMESFGTLVSNVASSMQDNPGSAFKILKKALVINQDINQEEDENNKNIMNMIGNIPVDDSIKNMIYSHKELYTNDNPNEIWENLSSDDESENESKKKTIEDRKNKKY